jgi:4-hydroxybenzoate polyprenyltransferase
MRPHQWIKNLLVFAGPVFALKLLDPEALTRASATFLLFCAASSSVYLFNDIRDRERDRLHPKKCTRPIAAGKLSVGTATLVSVLLAVVAIGGSFAMGPAALGWLFVAYLVMQLAYTMKLKEVPIVDAIIVATGFVMRAVAGALAIQVEISTWLLICTTFFALFISLAKRRHELASLEAGSDHRAALAGYDVGLLDQLIGIATSASLMAYALYTVDAATQTRFQTTLLPLTLPFVIYAFFRFLYLTRTSAEISDPARALLQDRGLLVAVSLWGLSICAILYSQLG